MKGAVRATRRGDAEDARSRRQAGASQAASPSLLDSSGGEGALAFGILLPATGVGVVLPC